MKNISQGKTRNICSRAYNPIVVLEIQKKAYWTVTDVDLDGKPEVEYSPERNYIWKIKKLA